MVVNKFFKNIYNSKFFYFIVGIFIAYLSSLSVLDIKSEFWLNDESQFYLWAKNDIGFEKGYLTTLRYYFFIAILKLYFIFLSDPFYIVLIHKILVIYIYVFILGNVIIRNYDFRVFVIIFISLNYLNLFFLRDSLIALIGLSFLLSDHYKYKFKNYIKTKYFSILSFTFHITSILFIRAQIIFLYIKPKFSIPLFFLSSFLILNLYLNDIDLLHKIIEINFFKNLNLFIISDNFFFIIVLLTIVFFSCFSLLTYQKLNIIVLRVYKHFIVLVTSIISIYFIFVLNFYINYFDVSLEQFMKKDVINFIKIISISLNNFNPFNKVSFYLSSNNFLALIFCVISSLFLILFIIQVLICNLTNHFNFSKSKDILVGLTIIFLIYGSSKIYMDVRIMISALIPFFLFIDFRFFNVKGYFLTIIVSLFASLLNFFI